MHFVGKKELSVPKMKLQKHTLCILTKFFQRNWSCHERIIDMEIQGNERTSTHVCVIQ